MTLPPERLAELMVYAGEQANPPDEVASWLIDETHRRFPEHISMQSSWDQALLLGMLTRLARPRLAVEVGTFTGLAALAMARELPPGGRLLVCDIDEDFTELARQAWERAGMTDRIDLKLAPATTTLAAVNTDVDFAFVDADKGGYSAYLDLLLPRLAGHGLLAFDNTLSAGRVLDGPGGEGGAIVAFNDGLRARSDCRRVLLPIRDGLTLVTHA